MNFDTPVLPNALAMQLWLSLGWGVVLASAVARLGRGTAWTTAWPVLLPVLLRSAAVVLVAALCWLPGPYFPVHWLGLAFQSPSITTVLLCGLLLWPARGAPTASRTLCWFAAFLVALGWLLLLDALALLPLQLYAWGFSTIAAAGAMLVALLPWAMQTQGQAVRPWMIFAPCAVLVFVALRLPTGNVWDALLDPWLWGAMHVFLIRTFYQFKSRKDAHD